MRLLVTGGRDYADAATVAAVLDRALASLAPDDFLALVHGAARGLDTLADQWGRGRDRVRVEPYPADWDGRGRAAGHERNARMVASRADFCIAFPGGFGTADCLEQARRAGIRCGVVDRAGVLRWDTP
jgi:hypothetical protein